MNCKKIRTDRNSETIFTNYPLKSDKMKTQRKRKGIIQMTITTVLTLVSIATGTAAKVIEVFAKKKNEENK